MTPSIFRSAAEDPILDTENINLTHLGDAEDHLLCYSLTKLNFPQIFAKNEVFVMTKKLNNWIGTYILSLLFFIFASPVSAATVQTINPYLSAADSPYNSGDYTYFYLEDFEDGLLNTPGVTGSPGGVTSVVFGPSIHDSVDGDDGAIDGSGLDGDSYFYSPGANGINFTFDDTVLGTLPTVAGVVWTDGAGSTTFSAYDAADNLLDTLTLSIADASFSGTTGEDTFFGITNSAGISRIFISNSSGGIEVDHLQYGGGDLSAIPIPAAAWLFGTALIGLFGFSKSRKAA